MVAGTPPIRATKARYFEDRRLQERIVTPPALATAAAPASSDDPAAGSNAGDPANAGIRREPELPEHEEIVAPPPSQEQEFELLDDEPDVDAAKANAMRARMRMVARQASLDPGDGIEL